MAAKTNQELSFLIKHLHSVLHAVGYPDVAVAVDRNPFRAREVSRPVTRLAECADEGPIAIEYLNAIVERVGYVEIAITINCQPSRTSEVAGSSKRVFLSGGADSALQLKGVRVIDEHLILIDIGNVEQPVFDINCHGAGPHKSIGNNIDRLMLGVEHQNVVQPGIGNKQAVVIIHG